MLAQRKEVVWEQEHIPQNTNRKKRIRVSKTTKDERALNNKLRTKCIILFCMVSLLAVFFILRSGVAASSAYALNQMKNEASVLEAENARLHLDIAYLKSPERIQSIATGQLGMILPEKFFFSTK